MSAAELDQLALLGLVEDLDAATNLWGEPLTEHGRAALFAVVTEPCEATWEATHGLIISGRSTLWQAVVKFTDYHVIIRELGDRWPSVPTTAQLLTALHEAAESGSEGVTRTRGRVRDTRWNHCQVCGFTGSHAENCPRDL